MSARKKDLVFVAGLGSVRSVYAPLLELLKKDATVRQADHPAELPDYIDWDFFLKPIDDASKGLDKFILMGHSLGGSVALKYAARHPEHVRKVIAVAPILFPMHSRPSLRTHLRRIDKTLWLKNLSHFYRSSRSITERMDINKARLVHAFAGQVDLSNDLKRLQHATILFPKHEEIVPRLQADRIKREYPHIRVRAIPGSHQHMALLPDPLMPAIREELHG